MGKTQLTILISSAGRRVELLNCFREDARELGLGLRVIATDCNHAMSSACQVADHRLAAPRCTDPMFISRMLEICSAERVDLVVPTIDTELPFLAEARAKFEAAGTRVAVSDLETVTMARDKFLTAAFLERKGVASPRSLLGLALLENSGLLRFPLILKPRGGSCSVGLREVENMEEIRDLKMDLTNYVAQEKWLGREYTVNMFFDDNGHCCAAVPHWRYEVRGGEVSKGVTERQPLLAEFSARLAAALPGARGALCYQAIVTEDGGVVFEINARFGGGYPLTHRAGARFSRWLLEQTAGLPCSAHDNWQEGLTMLRYDAAVFVAAGKK